MKYRSILTPVLVVAIVAGCASSNASKTSDDAEELTTVSDTAEQAEQEPEEETENVGYRRALEEGPDHCEHRVQRGDEVVMHEVFTFDESGYPVKRESFQGDEVENVITIAYEGDNVVRYTRDHGGDGSTDSVKTIEYDAHGNEVRVASGKPDEEPLVEEMVYDDSGEKLMKKTVSRGDTIMRIKTHEYDEEGRLAKTLSYESPSGDDPTAGEPTSTDFYVYDADGNRTQRRQRVSGNESVWRYEYDDRGRKLTEKWRRTAEDEFRVRSEWRYGEGDEPIYERRGGRCRAMTYDDKGRLLEVRNYREGCGEDGVEEDAKPANVETYDYACHASD